MIYDKDALTCPNCMHECHGMSRPPCGKGGFIIALQCRCEACRCDRCCDALLREAMGPFEAQDESSERRAAE